MLAALLFAATGWFASQSIPQQLTPPEDHGVALLSVTAPQGVSIDHTDATSREIETMIAPLRDAEAQVHDAILRASTIRLRPVMMTGPAPVRRGRR
ncbi:MAG: hypothetical protein JJU42_01140 [Rhodobacteraceae bacterium]|nr:hypothetical protein [Paracoccaceae bacterium]